jgi:DNA (cytosine-5)-methyltransferase 1
LSSESSLQELSSSWSALASPQLQLTLPDVSTLGRSQPELNLTATCLTDSSKRTLPVLSISSASRRTSTLANRPASTFRIRQQEINLSITSQKKMAPNATDPKSLSPFVDLTNDGRDGSHPKAEYSRNRNPLTTSTKRKMSDSVMDDSVDHIALQASIEQDVLQPTRPQLNGSFGSLKQAFKISKPARTSTSYSKVLEDRSRPHTLDQLTIKSPSGVNSKHQQRHPSVAMLEDSPRSTVVISDSEDDSKDDPPDTALEKIELDGTADDVIDIKALYPVQRPQQAIPPGAEVINLEEETGNAIADEHRLDHFDSDYLDDDGFKAASIRNGNYTYKPGKCAQMSDPTFIRIKSIHRDFQGDTWLIGDHLARTSLQGPMMLEDQRNELVWVLMTNDTSNSENSTVKRQFVDAVRIRNVHFTNQPFKRLNTGTHADSFKNAKQDLDLGELFCRVRHVVVRNDRHNKVLEESIEPLSPSEADDELNYRVDPGSLRNEWRGIHTASGGSFSETHQTIALDGKPETVSVRKYTYGDAFCGGGGATRGAIMAGLRAVWGFDCDASAILTYGANFAGKGTRSYEETVHEFLLRVSHLPLHQRRKYMVDILHISPPCQPFSSAHTRPNEENDAKNQAALFSVLQLLQTIKPRVVTIEETEGLLTRHIEWFSALINIIVSVGYSVRWRRIHCKEYGVPQNRTRLYIIASGPGETLPQVAERTHGEGEGMKKPVTVGNALAKIPRNAPNHQKTYNNNNWEKPKFTLDQQANTVTCDGGKNWHPNPTEKRKFTDRELARLQTFPDDHRFVDSRVTVTRRQVGNAVPPLLAKTMDEKITRSLKETDGVGRR